MFIDLDETDPVLKNFSVVTNPQDVGSVLSALDNTNQFMLDLETTGLKFMQSSIHGVALATETQEWYVTLGAEQALLEHLGSVAAGKLVIGHNIGYDMHFLHKHGVHLDRIADTMIGQFLVDENQGLGLKSLASTKLGFRGLPDFKELQHQAKKLTGKKKLSDVTIYDMPLDRLALYAGRDVRLTGMLWERTQTELDKEGMTKYFWETKMPFVKVLTAIEEVGFFIDQERLAQLKAEFTKQRDEALELFLRLSGNVNPNSPQQLAELLYVKMKFKPTKTTGAGAPSTDVMSLTRLLPKDKTGVVQALMTYRKLDKIIGTYITAFEEGLVGGRLYGSFNQLGDNENSYSSERLPRTGRLSSSDPNLQNIPARGEFGSMVREMFSVPLGYTFLDVDYSQLELRIAAHYTKDPNLLKVFAEGGDPHQMTADLCTVERYVGKTLNFANLYGAGPIKLADTVEKSGKPRPTKEEAAEWLRKFDLAYPAIKNWKTRVVEYASDLGYVRTIAGRKRRLPDITSRDTALKGTAERQAVNTIIQGSAADIIEWAMLRVAETQESYGARMSAQVHDELTNEVPVDVGETYGDIVSRIMVSAGEHFGLRVRLEAEPHTGPNWSAAKGK